MRGDISLPERPLPSAPCVAPPHSTSFDVANEVSGDILVVDAAGRLVKHDISGSWSLPVGRRVGAQWETT